MIKSDYAEFTNITYGKFYEKYTIDIYPNLIKNWNFSRYGEGTDNKSGRMTLNSGTIIKIRKI